MLSICVKDLVGKSKIYDGKLVFFLMIADVLEFKVPVSIPKRMNNFKLRNEMHPHQRYPLEIKAVVQHLVFEVLVYLEVFKYILTNIRHHDLSDLARNLCRYDEWETTIAN